MTYSSQKYIDYGVKVIKMYFIPRYFNGNIQQTYYGIVKIYSYQWFPDESAHFNNSVYNSFTSVNIC